jgi:nascent polypeptide-associated complex subunit alpha
MFGGLDPKKMQAMMSQMGIKQVQIDADEVIIKTRDGNILIKEPSVMKITMSGQDSFQISGKVTEAEASEISEDDIKIVMSQANSSKEKVKDALKKSGGDIAEAILSLKH